MNKLLTDLFTIEKGSERVYSFPKIITAIIILFFLAIMSVEAMESISLINPMQWGTGMSTILLGGGVFMHVDKKKL